MVARNPHLYGGNLLENKTARQSLDIISLVKGKRLRQDPKPLMNKLEAEAFEYIKRAYDLPGLRPQALRFRLANGLWYKPDFTDAKTLSVFEIKGPHAFRGGFENLKSAAFIYPEWNWKLLWKQNNAWMSQDILP